MRRKKFWSQIETKEVPTLPRLVLVKCIVATGLVGVDILIVLLAEKKKRMVYSGVGVVLGFDIHMIRLYVWMKTRAFIVSLKHLDLQKS